MPSYGIGRRDEDAFDFPLPSGNVCRMKRADLQALIGSGVIDSIDMLTSLVQTEHVERVKKGKKTRHLQAASGIEMAPESRAVLDIMRDKKRWQELETVVNGVVSQCVLEPKVLPAPEADSVRPAAGHGKVYVDEVALVDKLAIFSEAMSSIMAGQKVMEPFREGREAPVAGVGNDEDVPQPAERTAGDH